MHEKPEPTPLGWPILPRHNQPFTPPAGAHCSTNPHEGRVGWVGKEKSTQLSALRLRRIRLELPPGASRKPAGALHRVPPVLRLCLRTACRDWCFPEANASAYCWCCDCVCALHAATGAFLKQMPVRTAGAAKPTADLLALRSCVLPSTTGWVR